MNIRFGLMLAVGLLSWSTVYSASDEEMSEFKRFQQSENKAFKTYVIDQKAAFSLYKASYEGAFRDYKAGISKVWDKPEVSTAKKWVSYSPDFKQKTVVDYAKGTVSIAKMVDKNERIASVFMQGKARLLALNEMTYQSVYDADPIAQKVDKELVQKVSPSLIRSTNVSTKVVPIFKSKPRTADLTWTNKKDSRGQRVVTATYKLKSQDVSLNIKKILPSVMKQAKRQRISPALVLAIVKNESSFNPLARSHIPAYGLMQIVPRSAGKDATKYLFGRQQLLTSSYLYNPDKNIVMGAAYLHILNYSYLKKIKNPQSRLYCTIAAYNTGAGNVAKAFTGKYSVTRAAKMINKKSPQEVYRYLLAHLPHDETKAYLKRVNKSYTEYSKMFN